MTRIFRTGKSHRVPTTRRPDTNLEDLRDDCVALFLDSGLTYQQIHERGGPTPGTISRWLYRETKFPRLDTIRSMVQACGAELAIVPRGVAEQRRQQPVAARLDLTTAFLGKPRMPRRRVK